MSDTLTLLVNQLIAYLQPDEVQMLDNVGLTLYRADTPISRVSYVQEPSVCFILRGQKTVYWGDNTITYGDGQFLCYSVEMPLVGEVLGASADYPYTGIQMKLDNATILNLLNEIKTFPPNTTQSGIEIGQVDEPMLDALHRLVNLACYPDDLKVLAPLIRHELHYRLLKSPIAPILAQMGAIGGHNQRISQAIVYLKENFAHTVTVETLADIAKMSVPNFYKHFRQITAISPLQYQKSLQLTEARRLILLGQLSLAQIAHQVGYESPSQFSREYKRYFGISPSADKSQG
ncbi:AraC family transcriptional regulator [Actinobacillus capsulatus]|uniref:AraC family transcriptional regulator n=1 Tax=Actinobacillus capsulatus TaxID=717 RepID=UPI00037147B3|nr:AraC family transcriptional regulator [Actinobacillus capsulatus]